MNERFWLEKAIQVILATKQSDIEKTKEIITLIDAYKGGK
jgi:hypothetical protein